jgi:hypothetical protein
VSRDRRHITEHLEVEICWIRVHARIHSSVMVRLRLWLIGDRRKVDAKRDDFGRVRLAYFTHMINSFGKLDFHYIIITL